VLPALLACVLLFTGCENRDPEKTETVRVGVAIYQQDDTFISNVVQEMERLAREKEGESLLKINLSIADGQSNQRWTAFWTGAAMCCASTWWTAPRRP